MLQCNVLHVTFLIVGKKIVKETLMMKNYILSHKKKLNWQPINKNLIKT